MKNNRKGFTLIELLIVVVIVGILALAAIPLITSNTRDARRAEGEQMLGSLKGQARVGFAKTGSEPATLTAAGVAASERNGKYFTVADAITVVAAGVSASIQAAPKTASDGTGTCTFNWSGGDGTFVWA